MLTHSVYTLIVSGDRQVRVAKSAKTVHVDIARNDCRLYVIVRVELSPPLRALQLVSRAKSERAFVEGVFMVHLAASEAAFGVVDAFDGVDRRARHDMRYFVNGEERTVEL